MGLKYIIINELSININTEKVIVCFPRTNGSDRQIVGLVTCTVVIYSKRLVKLCVE